MMQIRGGRNDPQLQNFLRLANNYHRVYPHLNQELPNANIAGMKRIIRKMMGRLYFGPGYYKRRANWFRYELERGGGDGEEGKKPRITANWVGPFADVGNRRYKHWVSRNGKYKFYPYQTRKGTMIINGTRIPLAKNKFIFSIPGYKY